MFSRLFGPHAGERRAVSSSFSTIRSPEPAHSPGPPQEWVDFSGRICVFASQRPGGAVGRADKLYSCEDARLVASELTREWPSVTHEIKGHPAQAARLTRS